MARIGSFGDELAAFDAEPDTYAYFGVDLQVNPGADAALYDFLEASGNIKESDPKSLLAVKDFMRKVFRAGDFDRFWELADLHGQNIEQRMQAASEVIAALAARPTGRPTGSSGGPPRTVATSTVDYALAAQRQLEEAGRPDLAVAALRFREAQERRAKG